MAHEEYRERNARLPGAVLWTNVDRGAERRVLPDGCTDLLWLDGRLVVAGPDTRAHLVSGRPGARNVGLRLPPGVGPAAWGVPAHALRDLRVPLAELWPGPEVRRLEDRLATLAPDGPGALARVLEDAAERRMRESTTPVDPGVGAVVAAAERGLPVTAMARELGIGVRQLHRRSLAAFGYGPKLLARVVRLRRALALARRGTDFATVAFHAGYADQAHLSREVRSLAGVPLGVLVRPYRAGPPDVGSRGPGALGAQGSGTHPYDPGPWGADSDGGAGAHRTVPNASGAAGAPEARDPDRGGHSVPGSGANRSTPLPSGSSTTA